MIMKKSESTRTPWIVSILRVAHCFLFFYVCAIIGGTFFLNAPVEPGKHAEQLFSILIAAPMLWGSASFWLAVTARVLFIAGIFSCAFVTFVLAGLPTMTSMFFPTHFVVLGLAGTYGISCIVLVRHFFSQPTLKKK